MLKKFFLVAGGGALVAVAILATIVYLPKLAGFIQGVGPVVKPPPQDITKPSFNLTGLPLSLPPGFSIEIFAKGLPGARVLLQDSQGNFWVSQTQEGVVSYLEVQDGKVVRQETVLKNLRKPHGLAFDPEDTEVLYVAEEDKISRVRLGVLQKIADLPAGEGHFTRTIKFGPDGRLYVSIGSSCNVCREEDSRRAAIYSLQKAGSDFKPYATGLRNAVFFTWSYVDGRMWATEMGRDFLGDDLPPDEINIVESIGPSSAPPKADGSGQNPPDFGWPECYGKNIRDPFGQDNCQKQIRSHIDIPAHSAPLGLAFIPKTASWPKEYHGDLLVAYHGSWNRSVPTGYIVVRMRLDEQGNLEGMEDFITGFLTSDGALGRPVDILIDEDGVMFMTDDKAGVIYKITYEAND